MATTDASSLYFVKDETLEHPDNLSIQALGFWLYLMSDLIIFGTLFATYAVLGGNFAGGPTGKDLFHLPFVFVETLLLLFSSFAFGLVTTGIPQQNRNRVLTGLAITFLLGLSFVAMEIYEFHAMISNGHGPGVSAFLSSYFTLVGTHGIHVTFGLVWILTMLVQVATKGLNPPVQSRLLRLGMFWHFLDIVWIGIFSVVYLLGVL
jgi:cytochrome o ubiquinol oxidase subunit 3